MARPVTAIVTGFTKNPDLPGLSLAPLRALKRKGVIRRIVALTWDSPEIDGFVAPLAAMDDVETIRVPQPDAAGGRYQTGVVYQLRSLEAALQRAPEPDALIVKLRPDFIFDTAFLENKIVNFETLCAPSTLGRQFDLKTLKSPFAMKVWIPWADANQPFFYEDAAFIGLKRDIAKLADRRAEDRLGVLGDRNCGWFAHVVRFAMPFLDLYPMFERYIDEFRYFQNDVKYRIALLPKLMGQSYHWYLLLAHAWILANSFHVDCGETGQLKFYANIYNQNADWSSLDSLRVNIPYDDVARWRDGQAPGGMMPGAARVYGRLVDDSWQHALFSKQPLRDLTPETLRTVLRNVGLYRQGLLTNIETDFFRTLSAIYRDHWEPRAA